MIYATYVHNRLNRSGEPSEDDEMSLSSRHRFQNLSPGGLGSYPSPMVMEAPHNTESLRVSGNCLVIF